MRCILRLLAFSLGLACATAPPARAFVRETTDSGIPVFWKNPCITMHFYLGSPPPLLTTEQYLAAATQSAAVWSQPSLDCTDMRVTMVTEPETAADIGYDKKNVLVFRQDTWCRHPPPPQDAAVPEPTCYPNQALAVTTIFRNGRTGELLDTDIEVNAVNYAWVDLVAQPELAGRAVSDFQYALTHELGHVIGLDHSCYTGSGKAGRPKDHTGSPAADCYSPDLSRAAANAIMFPSVSQIDVSGLATKRALTQDDRDGACFINPVSRDGCSPSEGGCNVAAESPPKPGRIWRNTLLALAGIVAAVFVAPRIRRRRA